MLETSISNRYHVIKNTSMCSRFYLDEMPMTKTQKTFLFITIQKYPRIFFSLFSMTNYERGQASSSILPGIMELLVTTGMKGMQVPSEHTFLGFFQFKSGTYC